MKKVSVSVLCGAALLTTLQADPFKEAEVTRVVNQVSILKEQQKSRPASVGDVVNAQSAVKTGVDSRAELQFPDKTITRLGSNALFRFDAGGRAMDLDGGTMLFSSPKGEGGGQVQAGAVTAAVTGTDFLLSFTSNGEVKVIVLEGKVLVYLTKFPAIRQMLRTGQIIVVPKGATSMPQPYTIDLKQLLSTSRLLESGGFTPLYSQNLLNRVANSQQGRISNPRITPPNPMTLDQQTAQITRRGINPGNNTPVARPNPTPPRPQATPFPTPPRPPRPTPTPGPSVGP